MRRFIASPFVEKRFFVQALGQLLWAKLTIAVLPYSYVKKRLGQPLPTVEPGDAFMQEVPDASLEAIAYVKRAIARARRCLPFHCQCLVNAITAKRLLNKMGIQAQLYLGVKKEDEQMKAHAWVKVGGYPVVETRGAEVFTCVQVFG